MNTKYFFKTLTAVLTGAAMLTGVFTPASAESVQELADTYKETVFTLSDTGYSFADILSNADSGFLYKDQLDANNLIAYDVMDNYMASPSEKGYSIKLSEPVSFECSSRSSYFWTEEENAAYANGIAGSVMQGVIAYTLDHPELFWISFADVGFGVPDSGLAFTKGTEKKYKITVSQVNLYPNYDQTNFESMNEVLEIRDKTAEAEEAFSADGETDYEKCRSIYRTIIDTATYDLTAPYAHGVAGVLYDTNAVCEGYAKTFKLLCDKENIPCICVLGNYEKSGDAFYAHMWNYVYLDGAWYGCDPTFDEATGSDVYFMRGSKNFNGNHRAESPYDIMVISVPEMSETDYVVSGGETTTTTTETTTTTTETTTTTTETTTSVTETTTTTTETTTSVTETTTTTTETTSSATETTTTTTETTTSTTETTITTTTTEEPKPLCGDVNGDGKITVIDLVLLRKYLAGAETELSADFAVLDCNLDGRVNIFDALTLSEIILGIKTA